MEDISREWWIGYILAYIGGVAAIALAAWLFLIRPAAPTPSPPPPPVAKVEAPPPPPPPEFAYPARPEDPGVRELLRKLERALQAIPPCRIETEWVYRYFEGATPQERRESGGRVLSDTSSLWLIEGNSYRLESHVKVAERHPRFEGQAKRRTTPYDFWEVRNGQWEAEYYEDDPFIKTRPLHFVLQSSGLKFPPPAGGLRNGFRTVWSHSESGKGIKLQWSIRTEPSPVGDLALIAGDPIPDSPDQHVRCELVLDPARDHLIVRESYWMNGTLIEEETNELQQLPDGRWFPKRNERLHGETVSITEYTKVEMDVDINDDLFEMESIPCDLEKVLAHVQAGWEPWDEEYMGFVNGFWKKVPPPKRGISTPNAKLEWAVPKE